MRLSAVATILFCAGIATAKAAEPPLTIFAAASLPAVVGRIDALWVAAGHPPPEVTFGGSTVLGRRIQSGEPADVLLSSDVKPVDALDQAHLIVPGSRLNFAQNTLIVAGSAAVGQPVEIVKGTDLAALIGSGGRLAIADPGKVPAGTYAEQALRWIGAWDQVRNRLLDVPDVRAALHAVANGDAVAAIVYRSDINSQNIELVGEFPIESTSPLVYCAAAVTRTSQPAQARAYLTLLHSPAAQGIIRDAGFASASDH